MQIDSLLDDLAAAIPDASRDVDLMKEQLQSIVSNALQNRAGANQGPFNPEAVGNL
jgi:hypothetical protein